MSSRRIDIIESGKARGIGGMTGKIPINLDFFDKTAARPGDVQCFQVKMIDVGLILLQMSPPG